MAGRPLKTLVKYVDISVIMIDMNEMDFLDDPARKRPPYIENPIITDRIEKKTMI